ncbi:MAG: glycosyltransferase family 4 protein [ANME-2 cluster archaeon]|nr:glycosyltransferase family 4 protein [ANME-2 cluster archaeon]
MKIAFIYDAIYPWVKGGAERRIYEIGKRLASSGYDVHLYGIQWWDGVDVITHEGMTLHGVCGPRNLYVNGRRSISEAILFSVELFPHLLKEEFDIIDVCVFPYFSVFSTKIISLIKRTPMIITWHEVWGDYWYKYLGFFGFFGKGIEKCVSKLTNCNISVSSLTERNLAELGVRPQYITIVPNGIDLNNIHAIEPHSDTCDIIFAGRLIKEKNVNVLLETLTLVLDVLPDVQCHIIGNGPEKEKLKQYTSSYGLEKNVVFFGFMEYDEIIARMKSSKIFVFPSTREGFGMVVIEAFACGLPVITVKSHTNAAIELVKNERGYIVELDKKIISEHIIELLNDSKARHIMSVLAQKAAQEYDWDSIVENLTRIYEDIL